MRERIFSGIAALFCCAVLFGAAQACAADGDKPTDTQTVTLKITGMG